MQYSKKIIIHGFFSNGPLGLMNTAISTYTAIYKYHSVIKNDISYPALIKLNKIISSLDFKILRKEEKFIHIFCLQAHHSGILVKKILNNCEKKNNYFIGYWPWELADWPKKWYKELEMMNEIWCLSKFIYNSIPPLKQPIRKYIINPGFRIKKEVKKYTSNKNYKFIFSYDPKSKYERKNPYGLLLAFWNAFGFPFDQKMESFNRNVSLTIKLVNSPRFTNGLEKLINHINKDERINILKDKLDYQEIITLYKSHDCYISLHRSEGFGNAIAENLLIGNEVITLNYSGERDFCTDKNSHLVDFHLELVGSSYPHASDEAVWANPNLKKASEIMIDLSTNNIKKNTDGPVIDLSIDALRDRIEKRIKDINLKS